MDAINQTFELTATACDEVAKLVTDFCTKMKAQKRDALRYRLAIEDCLTYWLGTDLAGRTLTLRMGERFRTPFVVLEMEGPQHDPATEANEDFGPYCNSVLVGFGLEPEYSYARGRNIVTLRLKRRPMNQMAVLGLALAAALAVGGLGMLLPDNLRQTLLSGIVAPLYSAFFDMLTCIAGPMIFLSVAWGIYGIGDVETLGRIGKKLMLRFLRIVFVVACCTTPLFFVLGPGFSGASESGDQLSAITEMVLGIVPPNIVEPFASGNTLQIIFLAVAVSLALLFLGRRVGGISEAIDQVNALVSFLMGAVTKLVPFAIFLVVVNMIWSGTMHTLGGVWKLLVASLVWALLATIVFLVFTSLRRKVSVVLLAKKCMDTFVITLTTASCMAAFSVTAETCKKRLGIEDSLAGFGLPLSLLMHRPVRAILTLLIAFFFAGQYGVACDPVWLVMAVFVSSILAIAMPPIPGGGAVAYTMLFAQLGIPAEALALTLAVDVIADFYISAFEQVCLLSTLTNVAAEIDMIDLDVLRS